MDYNNQASEQWFVEEAGIVFEQTGLPRMAGRIFGWLLICDPPHQSTDQLAEVRMDALCEDREIDYVELTNDEWTRLRREQKDFSVYAHLMFNDEITINGMLVVKEQPKDYGLAA